MHYEPMASYVRVQGEEVRRGHRDARKIGVSDHVAQKPTVSCRHGALAFPVSRPLGRTSANEGWSYLPLFTRSVPEADRPREQDQLIDCALPRSESSQGLVAQQHFLSAPGIADCGGG